MAEGYVLSENSKLINSHKRTQRAQKKRFDYMPFLCSLRSFVAILFECILSAPFPISMRSLC